ncbi:MAG: DUF4167 domain-containing protein [Alphaproteobacteria bacterium]
MKQSNKNRQNGRHGNNNNRFGGNRHQNNAVTRNSVFDSSSVAGRIRGTSQQLIDKYLSLAKDAKVQDDRVLYETYMQYADHYTRMLDLAIQNEQAKASAIAAQQQAQREAALQAQQALFEAEELTEQDATQVSLTEQPENPEKKTKSARNKKQSNSSAEPIVIEDSMPLATSPQEDEEKTPLQPVMIEIPE